MKKITIIAAIFLLVVTGTSFFIYYEKNNGQEKISKGQGEYLQNYQQGQDMFLTGKFDGAVSYFNAAAASTKDYDQKGSAQLQLAKSYFYVNQPDQAVGILKNIINGKSYSVSYQASAFSVLASFCGQNLYDDFAKKYIFTDNFQNDLNEADGNTKLAEKNLSEKSLEIYPAEYADYRLAVWYGDNVFLAGNGSGLLENEANVQKIKDYLSGGDKLFAINLQNNQISKERAAFDYNLRARILGYLLVAGIGDRQTFDDAFAKALASYDQGNIILTQYSTDFWLRFHWAAFIAELDGSGGQDKLNNLLQPILADYASGEPIQANFFQALNNLGKGDNVNTYSHREALLIAKYNSQFKDILRKIGWSDAELGKEITPLNK